MIIEENGPLDSDITNVEFCVVSINGVFSYKYGYVCNMNQPQSFHRDWWQRGITHCMTEDYAEQCGGSRSEGFVSFCLIWIQISTELTSLTLHQPPLLSLSHLISPLSPILLPHLWSLTLNHSSHSPSYHCSPPSPFEKVIYVLYVN